eukprot:3381113-Pyramimonas_sp.AAC.1
MNREEVSSDTAVPTCTLVFGSRYCWMPSPQSTLGAFLLQGLSGAVRGRAEAPPTSDAFLPH